MQGKSNNVFDDVKSNGQKTLRNGNFIDQDMFRFDDEEPLPLPQKAPSFIENKTYNNSDQKTINNKKLVQPDDKYVRRPKGNFKLAILIDKAKLENNKKRLYEKSPIQKYNKEDFSCQLKNSNTLKDQS